MGDHLFPASGVLILVALAPGSAAAAGPTLEGCPLFPADNVWNARVDRLPVHPSSAAWIAAIGLDAPLWPDFGSGVWPPGSDSPIFIPFDVVDGSQPPVSVAFLYDDESDPGPYPIPPDASIEGGPSSSGDRHVLILDRDVCRLYELFAAYPISGGQSWQAGSGAVFDLASNTLRPAGWTSADAAGLPILPGLVRFDEVASGEIRHALRFTAPVTRTAYLWPARHQAGSTASPDAPPMGMRVRLRADFDTSGFSSKIRVVLEGLKRFGMMLADNGSPWYLSGSPDPRWDNDELRELHTVTGSDFEVVDQAPLRLDPDSAATVALLFADDFESGGSERWSSSTGLRAPVFEHGDSALTGSRRSASRRSPARNERTRSPCLDDRLGAWPTRLPPTSSGASPRTTCADPRSSAAP